MRKIVLLQMSSEPDSSFYGVYDGHAGKDAAAFAASHVHGLILESEHYPERPIEAIKEAFNRADQIFLDKGKHEVSKIWKLTFKPRINRETAFNRFLTTFFLCKINFSLSTEFPFLPCCSCRSALLCSLECEYLTQRS